MTDAFLVSCALCSFFVAVNPPALWSINYYLPSFFDGFHRRALLGTLLSVFGDYRFNYYFIASLQGLVLLSLSYILSQKAVNAVAPVKWVLGVYLISNFGIPFWTLVGTADQILYLLLLYSLRLPNRQAVALMAFTPLIHEMAVFTVIPLFLAFGLLNGKAIARLCAETAVFFAVFLVVYLFFQSADEADLSAFVGKVNQAIQCNMGGYYDIYRHSFTGDRMKNYYADYEQYITQAGDGYIAIPNEMYLYIALLVLAIFFFYKVIGSGKGWRGVTAVLAGCLSPLALGFFGWDFFRWIHLASFSAIILLLYHAGAVRVRYYAISAAVLALPSICLNGYLVGSPDDMARSIKSETLTAEYWRHELAKPGCPVGKKD